MSYYEEIDVEQTKAGTPSLFDSITELPRVMFEAGRLGMSWPTLLSCAPKGDGHAVMVLPGFMGGDESTLLLRRFLTQLGYKALPWLQGTNSGDPRLLDSVMKRFYRTHQVYGEQISLVGQSLGGVFSREIARQFPDAVRCVVTLGSPFMADSGASTSPMVEKLFEQMSGLTVEDMRDRLPNPEMQTEPLGMPCTAIYSKEDGVVHWRTCVEPDSPTTENIRVLGSHTGMAMNPDVLRVVADRLSQDPNDWNRFDTKSGLRSFIYPSC